MHKQQLEAQATGPCVNNYAVQMHKEGAKNETAFDLWWQPQLRQAEKSMPSMHIEYPISVLLGRRSLLHQLLLRKRESPLQVAQLH